MTDLDTLRAELPDWPDDVLDQWLLPYVSLLGWPPALGHDAAPTGRWFAILRQRPISEWRRVRWGQISHGLLPDKIAPASLEALMGVAQGALSGRPNLYTQGIADLQQRFSRIVDYITSNNALPRRPVLVREPDGLAVADGHHRLAAYFYCSGWLQNFDPPVRLPLMHPIDCWVGERPSLGDRPT